MRRIAALVGVTLVVAMTTAGMAMPAYADAGGAVVGNLSFSETTDTGNFDVIPPTSWQIEVTSDNCSPTTGSWPLTVTVPNNSQTPNMDVYVYTDDTDRLECEYSYGEDPVPDFIASFDPASGAVFPPDATYGQPGDDGFYLAVSVTNSVPPPPTVEPPTEAGSGSAGGVRAPRRHKHHALPAEDAAPPLPMTGPARMGTMLLLALLLLVVGTGLTVAGAPPRYRGTHRAQRRFVRTP